jgi:NADH-ubiquinone oxidoreductase chain 2
MFTNSINHLQKNIHSTFLNRITIITLFISIFYSLNTLYFQSIGKGISIYSGLYQITVQSHIVEILLLLVGIFILLGWPFLIIKNFYVPYTSTLNLNIKYNNNCLNKSTVLSINKSDQYSLIAIFSILGGSLLMSSLDLLSMYLSIELQSFALYILATLNKERLSATSAGLKYFLLGSLSSCFILLGSAIIYSYTGLTQFEAINTLMSVPYSSSLESMPNFTSLLVEGSEKVPDLSFSAHLNSINSNKFESNIQIHLIEGLQETLNINKAFTIGLIIIIIGFLFKISAAPFYQWAPDVYDGTPTIVTVWLTIIVKLTILIFLQGLIEYTLPDSVSSFALIKFLIENLPTGITETATFSDFSVFTGKINNRFDASLMQLQSIWPSLSIYAKGNTPEASTAFLLPSVQVGPEQIKNLLLISSLLSLLIGTIAGLSQIKVKRLLAFSSISHVGFLLLALGIYTQKSIDSFFFYLIQYSVTSLNIFLILLAFGYLLTQSDKYKYFTNSKIETDFIGQAITTHSFREAIVRAGDAEGIENIDIKNDLEYSKSKFRAENTDDNTDINYLIELKGQLYNNPVLSISFAICLFSMAGIPPLIGFFSKQFVLFSSIENGNNFLSIVAILVSVISASYYLKLIKITFFDSLVSIPYPSPVDQEGKGASAYPPMEELDSLVTSDTLGPIVTSTVALKQAMEGVTASSEKVGLSSTILIPNVKESLKQVQGGVAMLLRKREVYWNISNMHSYLVAILTFLILFFFLDPSILLNGTQLISLTIFNI